MPTRRLAELRPYHRNPRRGNVEVIAASLKELGQYRPIVVNVGTKTGRSYEVLAGNHTWLAAQKLDWNDIDTHEVDVDDETAARIVAIDNRAPDLGTYDNSDLLALLDSLPDLTATGWTAPDLDALRDDVENEGATEVDDNADDVPIAPEDPVTQLGDVWELGEHRLVCGDSTDSDVLAVLFDDGERADCMWTDPPYGVDYVGKTSEALTIQNDGAAGLDELLAAVFATALGVLRKGAPVYVAHADTERLRFEQAMRTAGFDVRQNLVWVKNTMALGRSDYHYRHEPLLYGFAPGGEGRLGRGGPRWWGDNSQTTVFEVDKPAANREHPTMKPVALITAMLDNSLKRGGIVFDPFAGSGSTLIAAQYRGATARVVELDPRYCDVIVKRWQKATGDQPVRDDIDEDLLADDR